MADLNVTLPAHGDVPWDAVLNAAIDEIQARVNDNTNALPGKVPTTRALAGLDLSADRTAAALKTALALVKGDVGLGSVDNTADTAKPVSTAQQTALDAKAPLVSPALTGVPTAPTAALGTNSTQIATMAAVKAAIDALVAGAPGALDTLIEISNQLATDESAVSALVTTVAGKVPATRTLAGLDLTSDRTAAAIKTALSLVKADVGLGSVDNTSDTAKPVSTAQQTVLDAKAPLVSPVLTGNPTAPTPSAGDNDTSIATTAFVMAAVAAALPFTVTIWDTSSSTWKDWTGGAQVGDSAKVGVFLSLNDAAATAPTYYHPTANLWFKNPAAS